MEEEPRGLKIVQKCVTSFMEDLLHKKLQFFFAYLLLMLVLNPRLLKNTATKTELRTDPIRKTRPISTSRTMKIAGGNSGEFSFLVKVLKSKFLIISFYTWGRKSGLVGSELDSRSKGCEFKSRLIQ